MEQIEALNLNNYYNSDTFKKKQKIRSITGSVIGVAAGLSVSIALSKKTMPVKDVFIKNDFSKSLKNLYNYTKIDYEGFKGFVSMVAQAGGAALGSLIGGLSVYNNKTSKAIEPDISTKDKIKADKKAKIKEALFMTNNVLIPTALVKGGECGLETIGKNAKSANIQKLSGSKIVKGLTTVLALAGGMAASLSVTNTINNKFIEKENADNKKMRPLDFIYHIDDIIPVLISSKNPICAKLPIDRALPLIYGFMGSKVGQESKEAE